jgi:hypothetical protein
LFVVHSCSVAVVFCVIAVLCWGSWANARKLAGKRWRFEPFYGDHVFGLLIVASVAALTLGSLGNDGRSFLAELRQIRVAHGLVALLAGVLFNVADVLWVATIDIAGMAVPFPVGIVSSVLAYGRTGPAVSCALVQGAAIVAALWGVFVSEPARTHDLLLHQAGEKAMTCKHLKELYESCQTHQFKLSGSDLIRIACPQ